MARAGWRGGGLLCNNLVDNFEGVLDRKASLETGDDLLVATLPFRLLSLVLVDHLFLFCLEAKFGNCCLLEMLWTFN